jgi:hypothetical protein
MRKRTLAGAAVLLCTLTFSLLQYLFILDEQRLTWKDYMKVQDGMTQAQIEGILGAPTDVSVKPGGGKEVHWFGRKEGMIVVEFNENGTMVRKYFWEDARTYRLSFLPRVRDD